MPFASALSCRPTSGLVCGVVARRFGIGFPGASGKPHLTPGRLCFVKFGGVVCLAPWRSRRLKLGTDIGGPRSLNLVSPAISRTPLARANCAPCARAAPRRGAETCHCMQLRLHGSRTRHTGMGHTGMSLSAQVHTTHMPHRAPTRARARAALCQTACDCVELHRANTARFASRT